MHPKKLSRGLWLPRLIYIHFQICCTKKTLRRFTIGLEKKNDLISQKICEKNGKAYGMFIRQKKAMQNRASYVFPKKLFRKMTRNSKVNTCDRVLFLKVFSCEFYIFHKSFYRTPDASNQYLLFFTSFCRMGGALENAENRWDIGRRREARSTFKARSVPSKWLW